MRPVLIGASAAAGLIVIAAIAVGALDRTGRTSTAGAPAASTGPRVALAPSNVPVGIPMPVVSEPPAKPPPFATGVVIDGAVYGDTPGPNGFWSHGEDFSFAIFAGKSANALAVFETSHGHYERALPPGAYEICQDFSGAADPICTFEKTRVRSCPPHTPRCSCKPPHATRAAWRKNCKQVEIAGVVRVSATEGPEQIALTCDPASACSDPPPPPR
jgi:hypothetical protein